MSNWQDINTAPIKPTIKGGWPPRIDILAKIWLKDPDKFVFQRFPDCQWDPGDSMVNRKAAWKGVDENWRPVAWMPIPEIPTEWPPNGTR